MQKTILIALMVYIVTLPLTVSAASVKSLKAQSVDFQMNFDGKTLKLPKGQYVFMLNGTSYVPIRFMSYALQKNVIWDSNTSTVIVGDPTIQQAVMLKEYLLNLTAETGEKASKGEVFLDLILKNVKFKFDGKEKLLPEGKYGYIVNGSLYIPVRFMSESVGVDIAWDQKNKKITAQSPVYKEQVKQTTTGAGESEGGIVQSADEKSLEGNRENGVPTGELGSGGGVVQPTYESITANAEQRLNALKSSCQTSLLTIGSQYVSATDDTVKAQLISQGKAELAKCNDNFNQILTEIELELSSNGYDTDIIAIYRKAFDDEVAAGRAIMEEMA